VLSHSLSPLLIPQGYDGDTVVTMVGPALQRIVCVVRRGRLVLVLVLVLVSGSYKTPNVVGR
jgi:hypothetical protein